MKHVYTYQLDVCLTSSFHFISIVHEQWLWDKASNSCSEGLEIESLLESYVQLPAL